MKLSPLQHVTEEATGHPYRMGNSLSVYQNGDEIFPAMLRAIQDAKHTIEFSTYVYWRSDIASQFADALIERAAAGVTVRLMVDAVGAAVMDTRTLWRLERSGVRVAWFRPVRWPYLHKFNNRTHRKILIIDGRLGFTGGVGIAAEWTGNAQDRRHWRETHCHLTGPACADLAAGFAENWLEATGEYLEFNGPECSRSGNVAIQTIISTATGRHPTDMDRLFLAVFRHVAERLWITTAYFVPSDEVMSALIEAAKRGVDVRILTNGPLSNHKVTWMAGRASYHRLLRAGVRIYEYQPTILHAKVITADQSWATLGSANLDARSLVHNDELNIAFVDQDIITGLDHTFEVDLSHSRQIKLPAWRKRGWWSRLAENSTHFIRDQL
jgi:cardiolipin synthase A/B